MIPYVVYEAVHLGPLTIHVWGLFVALGILFATLLTGRRARRAAMSPLHVVDLAFWITLGGILSARLWFLLEYGRQVGFSLTLIRVQDGGLSASGGVIGGLLAAWWFARRHRFSLRRLGDLCAPGVLLGEGVGRLGCFAIHDHLGRPTAFPLSVVVDGVQRHEVGLELALAGMVGSLVLLGIEKIWQTRPLGALGTVALLWYAVTRLGLDFLRATDLPGSDLRYGGLTLAQYAALSALVFGSFLLFQLLRSRGEQHLSGRS